MAATSTWCWARQQSPFASGCGSTGRRPAAASGLDVDEHGAGTVSEERLYQLIRQDGRIVDRTVEITFLDAGAQAYVFTFG